MSIIEVLEPVLTNSIFPDSLISQPLDNIIGVNANCKAITDYIHIVLPLTTLQRLVVEGIFNHVIRTKNRLCIKRKDQLLLYMRGERGVKQICVIYALEMGFTLLNRKNELMISVPIGYTTESIRRSTLHIALSISTCKAKTLCTNVSRILTHQSLLNIDELSMI